MRTGGIKNHAELLKAQGRRQKYHDEYYTPAELVKKLGAFDLDPCAAPSTSHAKKNFRKPADGLEKKWSGRVWLNPPYSRVEEWLAKFIAHGNGCTIVNSRTESAWFQNILAKADAVLFPNTRIKFFDAIRNRRLQPTIGQAIIAIGGGQSSCTSRQRHCGNFLFQT